MMADKDQVLRLLKTARGQLDGILKMVKHCVRTASSEQEKDEKIEELVQMLGKLLK